MTYRIHLTAQAEADIARIHGRLSRQSARSAEEWYESFCDAVERLRTNPFTCGLAFENSAFDEELRHLLFGTRKRRTFRALFVVREDQVRILAIRGPGDRPIRTDDVEG
jgi:hypothetical protein